MADPRAGEWVVQLGQLPLKLEQSVGQPPQVPSLVDARFDVRAAHSVLALQPLDLAVVGLEDPLEGRIDASVACGVEPGGDAPSDPIRPLDNGVVGTSTREATRPPDGLLQLLEPRRPREDVRSRGGDEVPAAIDAVQVHPRQPFRLDPRLGDGPYDAPIEEAEAEDAATVGHANAADDLTDEDDA